MKAFQYTIQDPMGFHARPAGAQLTRLMAVMGLGIKQGQTVTVTIDGPDEDKAFEELQTQFRENA